MPAYPNRTDLNMPKAGQANFTGQTYGQATQQRKRQRAVKPGPPPTQRAAAAAAKAQQPAPVTPAAAGTLGAFSRPTDRPSEPITAGAPFGPGPGVESISGAGIQPGSREDLYLQVRAIASRYPNPAILDLLSTLERRMMAGPPQGIARTSRITDANKRAT